MRIPIKFTSFGKERRLNVDYSFLPEEPSSDDSPGQDEDFSLNAVYDESGKDIFDELTPEEEDIVWRYAYSAAREEADDRAIEDR